MSPPSWSAPTPQGTTRMDARRHAHVHPFLQRALGLRRALLTAGDPHPLCGSRPPPGLGCERQVWSGGLPAVGWGWRRPWPKLWGPKS